MELAFDIGLAVALGSYAFILLWALLARREWLPARLAAAGRVIGRGLGARRLIGGPVRLLRTHPVTGGAVVSAGLGALAALAFVALLYAIVVAAAGLAAYGAAYSLLSGGVGDDEYDSGIPEAGDLLATSRDISVMDDGPLGVMKNGTLRGLNPWAGDDEDY